jgi:diguanylate cyclase (GGDEF)-like protein/PAS domain S-box-containing protein
MPRLIEAEALYRSVFEALDEGFCVIEIIFDEHGGAVDYRFVETNPAFEQHTGLVGARGRTAREMVPDLEAHWFETYGRVATSGVPMRFVGESEPMDGRAFDVFAFRVGGPESRRVALHFTDISRRKRAEEELSYRADQFHTLIEGAPLGVYLVDADFRIAEVNPTAMPVFEGIPDVVGRDFEEIVRTIWPEALASDAVDMFRHTMATGEAFHTPELVEVRADRGTTEYYDWRINRMRLPDGRYGVVCYFSDISDQVQARRAIAASEERYRTLFESIDEGFCILEVVFDGAHRPIDYRYLEINPAFERHTGLANALGRTIRELVPDIEPKWFDLYGGVALTGRPTRIEDHAASMGRWFDVYAFRVGEPHERKVAVLFNDITERKRVDEMLRDREALLRHQAHHDTLTGLPNRLLFEDRLQQALASASRHDRQLAVLFLDVDGFKLINDSHGHAAGDAVLVEAARRLRSSLREEDTIARLHGDEFAVVLPEVSGAADADRLARDLLATFEQPTTASGKALSVSVSIGVSLFPHDGRDAASLLRAADAAMYRAKVGGKHDVRHFASAMGDRASERVTLDEHLEGALERGEITLCYQPQWDGRMGSIAAFEALLRWTSPELGDVSPRRFVPIAEERGTFGPIAAWSLDACGAFAASLASGFGTPLRIALNVSPARLVGSGFVPQLEDAIVRHRLAPQQLELELGLTAMSEEPDSLRETLERVKALGARVTLDRFGADAAMVVPILDLPFDGVKIDPSLVQRADADPRLRRGLESVVGLVQDFGLDVVAVGVETESQRTLMIELGCERLQGTLIGRPMARPEAEAALRAHQVTTLF